MLQQIVFKTPLWVWPLLAFLVYRGLVASKDREVGLGRLFIVPAVMLGLSVQGIATGFGSSMAAGPVWLTAVILVGALTWQFFNVDRIAPHPERGTVTVRGSWTPMAMIMGIFLTKYAVNIALALHPELKQQIVFVAAICALYGTFNGIFLGQVLKIASIYRQGVARSYNFL
jgi:hypothetical protein